MGNCAEKREPAGAKTDASSDGSVDMSNADADASWSFDKMKGALSQSTINWSALHPLMAPDGVGVIRAPRPGSRPGVLQGVGGTSPGGAAGEARGQRAQPKQDTLLLLTDNPWIPTAEDMGTFESAIRHGIDVDARDPANGFTALMNCSFRGHGEMAEFLMERTMCDLEAKDRSGMTALYHAAIWGHWHIVLLLADYGADVNVVDRHGKMVLRAAKERNRPEVVDVLVHFGAQEYVTMFDHTEHTKSKRERKRG